MRLHPSHPHYVAPVLEREAQSPGQYHGPSSMSYQFTDADLQAQFLAWLEEYRPAQYIRHRRGDYITERTWQDWRAEWMVEPERRSAARRVTPHEVKWDIRTGTDRRQPHDND